MEATRTFSPDEIDAQIQRIAASSAFKNSPVLIRFLEFVTAETLQERGSSLKEYTIALNVLKRSADFNPQDDAVVRIHAGRLRRALNDYYLTDGINDTLIVHIPKGGYVPQFVQRDGTYKASSKMVPDRGMNPVVAIFPFKTIATTDEYRDFDHALGEQLCAELAKFPDVSVIGYYSAEMSSKIDQNILDAAKLLGVDYVVTGSLRSINDTLRVSVHLLITNTGEVLMTKTFESKGGHHDIFRIQDEVVENVIGAIGGYYGLIFQEMVKAAPAKVVKHAEIRSGIYHYYKYQRSFSLSNYNEAISSLQLTVKEYPNHAVSWAMLGELYLHNLWLKNKKLEDPLSIGYQCVLQAIKIDPLCQHAWHSLTLVHLLRGEREAVYESAKRCIDLNPNCPAIISGVAFMLICSGHLDEGVRIIHKGIRLSPYCPWWVNGGFSFYYLRERQYPEALFWAEKMNAEETFWDPILRSAALANIGNIEAAQRLLTKIMDTGLTNAQQVSTRLSSFLLSEELVDCLVDGLEQIGLKTLGNDWKCALA